MQPQNSDPNYHPPEEKPFAVDMSRVNKRTSILFAVAGLLIITALVALFLWPGYLNNKAAAPEGNPDLAIVDPLTSEKVAALDKNKTFWGYVKNAAMQQQAVVTHERFTSQVQSASSADTTYIKVGFNYKTKAFVGAVESMAQGAGYRDKTRCYDGLEYNKAPVAEAAWKNKTTKNICTLGYFAPHLLDGFMPGGLSTAQADAFATFSQNKKDLVNVTNLELADHNGSKYLHYSVDITPIATGNSYAGNYWIGQAFAATGLDEATLPYMPRGLDAGGTHIEYYIDAKAQLPVYSEITALPLKDASGKNVALQDFEQYRTLYMFGASTFDAKTVNTVDLGLDW